MHKLSKGEKLSIVATLFFVILITSINMVFALRRARDAQRKVDMGVILNALNDFQRDYGFLPKSENGKVLICKKDNFDDVRQKLNELGELDFELFYSGIKPCEWGVDVFADPFDDSAKPYLSTFPSDPKTQEGINYYYISNGSRYQIFTYLEGEDEETGYNEKIVKRNIDCGNGKFCSFGRGYGNTPLEISIEEYEKGLLEEI